MIEKIIYDYLKKNIYVPIFLEEPEETHERMLLIEKTGSSQIETNLYEAVIAIQSYDKSLYKTAELNSSVIKTMIKSIIEDKISKCELNSDYNFPDLEKNRYRYQAVFNITYLEE